MLEQYQFVIVGLIASMIVWLLKRMAEANGQPVKPVVVTTVLFVISFGLAVAWVGVSFAPFPPYAGDPGAFAQAALAWFSDFLGAVGGYVATAILIYQAFLKYLLDHGIPTLWRKAKVLYYRSR